jgi:hypothetical protein
MDGLIEIDVSQKYPSKALYLQDIAKVEYIPLETNANTLMSLRLDMIAYVSDDYIIATNSTQGDIFVFDGKGKSKFSFNHKGQGPMEYTNLYGGIAFDEKAREIFVFNRYSVNPKILVFAEDGTYKRTLSDFSDLQDLQIFNFDDETLLGYDETGVLNQAISDQKYANRPYLFMSKKDGSIVDTLNINLPVRLSPAAVWLVEQNGVTYVNTNVYPMTNNRTLGKDFLITDYSSDTIYKLTPQRELQPIIVRKPPMPETDPKILISNFLTTDKFICLGVYVMDYNLMRNGGNITQKQLMYDFETGQTNEYRFVNRDITTSTTVSIEEAITPVNTAVTVYEVGFLFGLDEKGEIKGDLKELLKSLDVEDNPVLMKIKF